MFVLSLISRSFPSPGHILDAVLPQFKGQVCS